jgi:UDP-N-acetylmuramoyl-tripeptide--D-alanyl-D-alanine ligase
MTLSLVEKELGGDLRGADVEFSTVSTDTRTLQKNDLYLALSGENFDGNEFVSEAMEKGACAAICDQDIDVAAQYSVLKVADCQEAFGLIASLNRMRSSAKVVALTGSQGKTSVKEMIGSILEVSANTLITEANLNNTIGVPLTMLKISAEHERVVLEMGANSAGEIAFSVGYAKPDIALITNANAAHIEGFGSLQGIVEAKGEIIDGLSADGIIVLNADDKNCAQWIDRAGDRKTVLFSFENKSGNADYYASDVEVAESGAVSFNLATPQGRKTINMNLLGEHNVMNAVSAAAVAMEAGASLSDIETGLAELQAIKGRLSPVEGISGSRLIDDSYNASPDSFIAAIKVLRNCKGRTILLAGEMKELGLESEEAHRFVGRYAAESGIDDLWASGESCKAVTDAFGSKARLFQDQSELIKACKEVAFSDVTFLIKGSRGARMDLIVNEMRKK